ncbi:MAG: hypothetical protein IH614_08575 [Desulfuromonadales bacterium]|nr:hypothetical protein [Desulfuromonadales bacterium]
MGFTIEDVLDALKIVKECKDAELHIDTGELKLSLFKGEVGDNSRTLVNSSGVACQTSPAAPAAPSAAAVAAPRAAEPKAVAAPAADKVSAVAEEGLIPIKANVTSVFYRRPSPEEPSFVEVGDLVQEDTVVCLLEVMKCFRQVTADVRGRVEKVCVESSDLVHAGTVMFLIRPD